jgi:hypothetical protein
MTDVTDDRVARFLAANCRISDDDEHGLSLEIEFDHTYAITLTIRKGAKPSCTLWEGSGEHSFSQDDRTSFRGWLDRLVFSRD